MVEWTLSSTTHFRREPLNEAHDSTFGILENYHCWRFHGSDVIVALQIIGLILFCTCMHHEYFLGRQCAFMFPIYVRKYWIYTIDRWIVCVSVVISPLRQLLDSYAAKTRSKMCHTFKQYFLLLTNLVIVFVHWVSTGVLCEPRQCSLFWDYIPESKLCFCVNLCRPSGPYSIRPIQKLLNCQTTTRGGSIHYGSAEGPPRVVENRNLLSHPDDLRKEAYLIRMT